MAQPKLGSGARFRKLDNSVAQNYEKKGISPKRAKKIGAAVAAEQGRKKYGAKKFNKLAAAGRRRTVGAKVARATKNMNK